MKEKEIQLEYAKRLLRSNPPQDTRYIIAKYIRLFEGSDLDTCQVEDLYLRRTLLVHDPRHYLGSHFKEFVL